MFNTEINHFLQLFNTPIIYWILNIISILGSTYFILFVLLSIVGGVDFKKGFLVAYIFGWTILSTVVLKDSIDYPRPLAVDSTLNSFGEEKVEKNLADIQPKGFFDLFSDELLSIIRQSDIQRTGFPSGHTSSQVAIWLSLALFFRKRWLWIFSISFILLTMISRLFLGKHYLGDVLGGLTLGLLIIGIFYFVIIKLDLISIKKLNTPQLLFFSLPLVLIPFYKFLPAFQVGSTIGFGLAFLFILYQWGNQSVSQISLRRIASVLIFFTIYIGFYLLGKLLPLQKIAFSTMIFYIATNFFSMIIATYLGIKLKLIDYKS